jgi:serine/threonine protein kinase
VRGPESPRRGLPLGPGDVVGSEFRVRQYLGAAHGTASYLCGKRSDGTEVVLKLVLESAERPELIELLRTQIRRASRIKHDRLVSILGMGQTDEGDGFVVMRHVGGRTLARALAQCRERGHHVAFVESFDVLEQLGSVLETVHAEMAHGVLTPYNLHVADDGGLHVGNLGFGAVMAGLLEGDVQAPAADSVFVAPEALDPDTPLTPAADIFSMGMITGTLLMNGRVPNGRDQARRRFLEASRKRDPALGEVLERALHADPADRFGGVREFVSALDRAFLEMGVDLTAPRPDSGLGVRRAETSKDAELFDIEGFDVDSIGPSARSGEEARFLVQKEGVDYGPFTHDEVVEQLYDEEIDENTRIRDRATGERARLEEIPALQEALDEFIPVRKERRRRERERREQIQKTVKKGGRMALVIGIVVGIAVLAGMLYFYLTRPDPEPLPLDEAFASLDYEFTPPPTEFQTVSVDENVLRGIFNPEASARELARRVERARSGQNKGAGSEGVTQVDMSESGEKKEHLSDQTIYNIILSNFEPLRQCVQSELRRNPDFKGVHIQFFIRPSGTTGGVKVREASYRGSSVASCLTREFRTMTFPEHAAISNKGVTFPLTVD